MEREERSCRGLVRAQRLMEDKRYHTEHRAFMQEMEKL